MTENPVLLDVDERGVATITMDDPERRNALSVEMLEGLQAAFDEAAAREDVTAAVLRSSHEKTFSSGANLAGFAAEEPLVIKHFGSEHFVELFRTIYSMPVPTLCVTRGHTLAGSLGVALCCDLILAGESASFGTPEINIGAFTFMIMAVIFRNVPRKLANELLLLGERWDAAKALEANIVNRVVPDAELDALAHEWSGKLASRSPVIMRLGKQAMRRQLDMPLDEALDYLRAQLTLAFSTDDIREGAAAFFEKREPVWKGH